MPNAVPLQIEQAFDPRTFLGRAGAGKTVERYARNQRIYGQGDVAEEIFFIQKGRVKITVLSEHGKEAVVGILEEGQFFGEACLEGAERRSATSLALEDCVITSITRPAMLAALEAEPGFSAFFTFYLLSRNSRMEDDLIDHLFNCSEKRLARLLLRLANSGAEGGGPSIPITLSQETLAEMIGTTRSRVSFFMNRFRKLGYVDYNGKIEVHQSLQDVMLRERPQTDDDESAARFEPSPALQSIQKNRCG
ncbi:MAG: Crp/Fnr family transcriptional regulator [Bradyrhizobium sp.]